MTRYAGGFKAGQPVEVLGLSSTPANVRGRNGVVAEMNDHILGLIQEGEVPVRIVVAQVRERGRAIEETAVYLLPPTALARVDIGNQETVGRD